VEAATANIATVKSQNAASLQAANDRYFAALDSQKNVINSALNATAILGQAQVALDQAILDSRQTGAQEVIPPNQVAGPQR
jgi:hypothetical protein